MPIFNALLNSRKHTAYSALVLTGLMAFQPSQAASLGRLHLMSSLGEPFKAEIDIAQLTSEELDTLKIRIASPETYKKQGLDYPSSLASIRPIVSHRGKNTRLNLTGSDAINEPIFDILVELHTDKGMQIKKFTAFLDPPSLRTNAIESAVTGNDNDTSDNLASLSLKPSFKLDTASLKKPSKTHSIAILEAKNTPARHKKPRQTDHSGAIAMPDVLAEHTLAHTNNRNAPTAASIDSDTVKKSKFKQPRHTTATTSTPPNAVKDTLVVSAANIDAKHLSQSTSPAIAKILVQNGIKDQAQIEKLINILTTAQKNNSNAEAAVTNTTHTNTNTNTNTAVIKLTPSNPSSAPSPGMTVLEKVPNTETSLPVTPTLTPVLLPAINPAVLPATNMKGHAKDSSWYDTLLSGTALLIAGALALMGLLLIAWRALQGRKTPVQQTYPEYTGENTRINARNTANAFNNRRQNSPNTVFPKTDYDAKPLETLTDFPISEIGNGYTLIQAATLASLNEVEPSSAHKTQNNLNATLTSDLAHDFVNKDINNINTQDTLIKSKNLTKNPNKTALKNNLKVSKKNTASSVNNSASYANAIPDDYSKELDLLQNLVLKKPDDLIAKSMLIKFLHKCDLREQAFEQLEIFKKHTQGRGQHWQEIEPLYQQYRLSNEFKSVDSKTAAAKSNANADIDIDSNSVLPADTPLEFSLASIHNTLTSTNTDKQPLHLDLGNLTILSASPDSPTDHARSTIDAPLTFTPNQARSEPDSFVLDFSHSALKPSLIPAPSIPEIIAEAPKPFLDFDMLELSKTIINKPKNNN
jgi:hypothetical protein